MVDVAEVWRQFWNPKERDRPQLEAGARRLMNTVTEAS
jgi:hypothetical protein